MRGDVEITSPLPLASLGDNELLATGSASGWRDVLNGEWYHRVEAVIRLTLTEDHWLDWTYENGVGAPAFTQGDQFSASLTIAF